MITSGGHTYRPSGCLIRKGTDGGISWHTIGRKDGKPLLEEILSVSIVEISRGTAEVSGVTRDGINSRWGQARRDGACWSGEDFRICIDNGNRCFDFVTGIRNKTFLFFIVFGKRFDDMFGQ